MRYDESMGALIATASELAEAARARGLAFSPLAPDWLARAVPESATADPALSQEGAAVLDAAVRALAAPDRSAVAHATVADALIRRMTLAWDLEGGFVVMAGFGPEGVALTVMPLEELYTFLAGSVGLTAPMTASLYRPSLSSRALFALLGCADALRAASMRATLAHASPSGSVSAEEIAQALADAATGDVRWLVPFVQGVLPFRVGEVLQAADVEAALAELADAGAVTLLEAEDGAPTIVEPTDASLGFFDGQLHENARLAVTLSESDGERIGQEMLLLVRSADGLWLADLSASGGAVAGLVRSEAEALLRSIAGLAEEAPSADPVASEPAPQPARKCPECGFANKSGDQFCRKCGTSLG
jgi:hypothetical protein